jgi:hypothetical protein
MKCSYCKGDVPFKEWIIHAYMHKECRKKERKDFRKEPEPKAKESHFSKKHPKPHTEKVTYPQFARKFLLAKLWGTFLGVGIIISIITFLSEFDFFFALGRGVGMGMFFVFLHLCYFLIRWGWARMTKGSKAVYMTIEYAEKEEETKHNGKTSGKETPLRGRVGWVLAFYFILNIIGQWMATSLVEIGETYLLIFGVYATVYIINIFFMYKLPIQYLKRYTEKGLAIVTLVFAGIGTIIVFSWVFMFLFGATYEPIDHCEEYCVSQGATYKNLYEYEEGGYDLVCVCYDENQEEVGNRVNYKIASDGTWSSSSVSFEPTYDFS